MSRILPGAFGADSPHVHQPHALTLLEVLEVLSPEQRDIMTRLLLEFAGALRKPRRGATHRTRDLFTFLASPAMTDWFTPKQLHELAGRFAVAGYVREAQDDSAEVK